MKRAARARGRRNPRILIVTPEITYLPSGMGSMANVLSAKAGGLADVSASLVSALFELGADVHVALPHYRRMFHVDVGNLISDELRLYRSKLPNERIHLAEDRIFYYRYSIYTYGHSDNARIALAFQREVLNNIISLVNPDLIHCNDWMTGLIPGMARRLGIPCLFTMHNIHTIEVTLAEIEDRGIDPQQFWTNLYFVRMPVDYEESRTTNRVDLLASGIFAAHFINTVSPRFLEELVMGWHDLVPPHVRTEVINKKNAGCAIGILNAPDPSYNPRTDPFIPYRYSEETHRAGKRANKREFQHRLGLRDDPSAPLFFWPSRLDPQQKGCQLLAEILYEVVSAYWKEGLQVAFVANGPYGDVFRNIVKMHDFYDRVAVCEFSEGLSRLGYAAADFCLMPSLFEPCGLPQMISAIYGTLTVAHDTGGLHDTVSDVDVSQNKGNGFLFRVYDSPGLRWAIDQAMNFWRLPPETKAQQITRVMEESLARFNHDATAKQYIELYEAMLDRPLLPGGAGNELPPTP
ncbi:MAG: glycogen synthase [Kiritimatiellia bacterium]